VRDSAVVLVDPASVPVLAGSEVDFVDGLVGRRLVSGGQSQRDRVLRLRDEFFDLN
jgi:Fe-S cluster assembly iron-binding protein IscA